MIAEAGAYREDGHDGRAARTRQCGEVGHRRRTAGPTAWRCRMHDASTAGHRTPRPLREAVTVQSCQMHDDAHAPLRPERVQSQPYVAMAIS